MKQLTPEEYEEILKIEVPEFRGPLETLLEGRKKSVGTHTDKVIGKHRYPLETLVEGRRYPMTFYYREYLTFIPETDCTFSFNRSGLSYSLDEGQSWTKLQQTTSLVRANNKVMFKGELIPNSLSGIGLFSSTGRFSASGNLLSLIYGDNFQSYDDSPSYAFCKLFLYNTNVISIANLILPKFIGIRACDLMFYGCSDLIDVPDFENCIASTHCYDLMFRYCTSLTDLRDLKINTVAEYSCSYMFSGCTSLLYAVTNLPAKELYLYCYNGMFNQCSNLLTGTLIEADIFAYNCCRGMFSECSKLNYMPPLTPKILADYSCYCMFLNCRKLTKMELGGAKLKYNCYMYMFNGCTNLSNITCLSVADTSATNLWTIDISETGTFVKKTEVNNWSRGEYGIPYGWEIINI